MIIYKTTNLINGKFYIGKTTQNKSNYLGSGIIIKQAISKYGSENFKRETLQECYSIEELNEAEQYWISEMKAIELGYNISTGGDGGDNFKNHPNMDEIRRKISETSKGRIWSDERKKEKSERMSGAGNFNYGKKFSSEHRRKLSESHKGLLSGEKSPNYGKKLPLEIRQKISETLKGRKLPESQKNKIANKIAKEWIIYDPEGRVYNIKNLSKFCKEHNLDNSSMCKVANGKSSHHKNWKCKKV